MMNSNKHKIPDISCFRLFLEDFLRESHLERLTDNRFIIACIDAATEAYEQAIRNGDTPVQAAEQANADTSFSKSDDPVKRQATRAVHNYFFLKSVETLREGYLPNRRNANIYDLCLYPERKNIQEIIFISQEMKSVSQEMKPVT
jgi:hypothetical protein